MKPLAPERCDDAVSFGRRAVESAVDKLCGRQSAPTLRSGWIRARIISAIDDAISTAAVAANIGQALASQVDLEVGRREHIRGHAKKARKEIRILMQYLAQRPSEPLPAVGDALGCENSIVCEQRAGDAEIKVDQRQNAQVHMNRLLTAQESLEWIEKLFFDVEISATRRLTQKPGTDRDTLVNELALIWTAATGSKAPASKSAHTPFHAFCSEILVGEGISNFDQSIASVCDRLDEHRLEQASAGSYEAWGL